MEQDKRKIFLCFVAGLCLIVALLFGARDMSFEKESLSGGIGSFFDGIAERIKSSLSSDKEVSSEGSIFSSEEGFLEKEDALPYEAALSYEEAMIKAVEKASPSVVSVIVSKDVPVIERCPVSDPLFGNIWGGGLYIPCPSPSGKTETKKIGGGTGFVVSDDGLILTNKHVVSEKGASYTVFSSEGDKYEAKVLAIDDFEDLALMKIEDSDLPELFLADSDSVRLGQTAIAIGNALGEYKNTVSMGVISGLSRSLSATAPSGEIEDIDGVFQTDAAINPGNSGGPLLNLKGQVIGVNTAVASGAENIGFAIPSNKARRVIDSYKRTGKITSAYLGIRYKLSEEGLVISSSSSGSAIVAGSPAEKAGLKEGDIVIEGNGRELSLDQTLSSLMAELSPGDILSLKVMRGSETKDFRIPLEERK